MLHLKRLVVPFSVTWDISPEAGADISLSSSSKGGLYMTTCNPAEGRWYQFFVKGCCAKMGDIVRQDRAFTIIVLLKLLYIYEKEYQELGSNMPVHSIRSCMFLLLTCLSGMRGYKAVWTDLTTLTYGIEYYANMEDYTAISWRIVEQFKSHKGIAGCYMITIAGVTNSGESFPLGLNSFSYLWGGKAYTKVGHFNTPMGHIVRRRTTRRISFLSLKLFKRQKC